MSADCSMCGSAMVEEKGAVACPHCDTKGGHDSAGSWGRCSLCERAFSYLGVGPSSEPSR